MWSVAVATIVVIVVLVLLRGPPELAKLEVKRGTVRLSRGRLPGRLLDDIDDIMSDPPVESAELRIVVEDGKPRLVARGLGEAYQQRLRNVLGAYSVSQIRAGQRRAGTRRKSPGPTA